MTKSLRKGKLYPPRLLHMNKLGAKNGNITKPLRGSTPSMFWLLHLAFLYNLPIVTWTLANRINRRVSLRAHEHGIDDMHDQADVGKLATTSGWDIAMVVQYLIHLLKDRSYVHSDQRVRRIYGRQNLSHPCQFARGFCGNITGQLLQKGKQYPLAQGQGIQWQNSRQINLVFQQVTAV